MSEEPLDERVLIADTTLQDEHLVARDPRLLADKGRLHRSRRQLLDEARAAIERAKHHVDDVEFPPKRCYVSSSGSPQSATR